MITVGTKIRVVKGSLKGGRIDKGSQGVVRLVQELGPDYSHAVRVDVEFQGGFLHGKVISFCAHHKNRLADDVVRLRGRLSTRMIEVVALIARPALGATMDVRGETVTVVTVHPLGTVDVRRPNGEHLRVTGLGWA